MLDASNEALLQLYEDFLRIQTVLTQAALSLTLRDRQKLDEMNALVRTQIDSILGPVA